MLSRSCGIRSAYSSKSLWQCESTSMSGLAYLFVGSEQIVEEQPRVQGVLGNGFHRRQGAVEAQKFQPWHGSDEMAPLLFPVDVISHPPPSRDGDEIVGPLEHPVDHRPGLQALAEIGQVEGARCQIGRASCRER